MRKYFAIAGFVAALIAASSAARAGTGEGSTSASSGRSSSRKVPTFTLDQAIRTALQRNPTLLNAEQEIKRTKGVIIEIRAQALPQITASGSFEWVDPNLLGARILGQSPTGTGTTPAGAAASLVDSPLSQVRDARPLAAAAPTPIITNIEQSDVSYNISVLGTQLVFNGTTWPSIRGTFFQRDGAYFSLRNTLDQLLATVKTQFYQVVVNRELIKVQEQSVHLLESQLKDQQNRFEAGTVPRFNVLQAEVQLGNQIPQLITAQNNYRISKLTLAKTMGLDFDPRRGEEPPLDVVGEMPFIERHIALVDAIELGKQRRPFLKQSRANVLNQLQQVRATAGQYLPSINTTGGGEWVSSPTNSSWHDISKGWIAQVQGSVPVWDSGRLLGRSYNSGRSFRKPRSLTTTTFGRLSWKCRPRIQICSRTSNLLRARRKTWN